MEKAALFIAVGKNYNGEEGIGEEQLNEITFEHRPKGVIC